MDLIIVTSKNGIPAETLPIGVNSWTDFWEQRSKCKVKKCQVIGCENTFKVNAHPVLFGDKEFVLPLCESCKSKEVGFTLVAQKSVLVSV